MKYLLPLADEAGCEINLEGPYEEAVASIFTAQGRHIMLWTNADAEYYFNAKEGEIFGGWYTEIGHEVAMGPYLSDTRAMEHALGIEE